MIERIYLPKALQIGVEYDLFWELNPYKLSSFVIAFQENEKKSMEKINLMGWINGLYVSYAIASTASEKVKYPKKPIDLFKHDSEDNAQTKDEKIFEAYAIAFNHRYRDRDGMT